MDIKEYLNSYNISEECKQAILELFDRPSLGRTMWDLGGGNKITKAIKNKVEDWKNKLDQPEASKAYDAAHKAHQETQARYNKGEATPSEMAKASGEFEKAKARFNKAHGYSSHTVPGAPKKEENNIETPEKPTKKEQIRSYLNKKGEHKALSNKVNDASMNYDYHRRDYEGVRDDDSASPSEKALLQHKSNQYKSKLIKAKDEADVKKSEITKARKELFPKSPKRTGWLPVYKKGTGKYKEVKEAFEAFDNSLLELNSLFEDIGTAISGMMDAQPITLAGKEQPSAHKQKKAQLNYKYKKLHRKEV